VVYRNRWSANDAKDYLQNVPEKKNTCLKKNPNPSTQGGAGMDPFNEQLHRAQHQYDNQDESDADDGLGVSASEEVEERDPDAERDERMGR
jgi:hypothetical protein